MSRTASITIEFDNTAQADACGSSVLEVDPGSGYEPGDTVYFRVWSADLRYLSLWLENTPVQGGIIVRNKGLAISEALSFSGSNTAQTQYPMELSSLKMRANTDIYYTIGNSRTRIRHARAGNVIGRGVIFDRVGFSCIGTPDTRYKIYGTINASYNRDPVCKSWSWNVKNKTGDYIFYVKRASEILASHTISVTVIEGLPKDIVITVREYTTEALLDGAAVTVDGTYKGTTDSNGVINVGLLQPGTHTIKITKSGYVDSDSDDLENDSFVVE